jgi:hypothetical protein
MSEQGSKIAASLNASKAFHGGSSPSSPAKLSDLSWAFVKDEHPTPEQRAERVLNAMFGKVEHSDFNVQAIAAEIREALRRPIEKLRKVGAQCGAGGHTQRQKMFEAIAKELEVENGY